MSIMTQTSPALQALLHDLAAHMALRTGLEFPGVSAPLVRPVAWSPILCYEASDDTALSWDAWHAKVDAMLAECAARDAKEGQDDTRA